MIQINLERIIPEYVLACLNQQGKTDKEIAEAYNTSPADIFLLRGWYGIKPVHIKPVKLPSDPNKILRFQRPMRKLVKWSHENGFKLFESIKYGRNEEIYKQYKLGYDLKKLAKMYFVTEKYLKGVIARRSREEKVKSGVEYQQTKDKPLTCDLLRRYKAGGKSDIDIGLLHGLSTECVWQLRKKYRIKGICNYRHVTISDKMKVALLEEYRKGKQLDVICTKHGISRLQFSALFSQYITPNDKAQRRSLVHDHEGQKKELLRLQQIHKTDRAIAKTLDITRQRVHQMRVKFGIPPLIDI